MIDLIKLYTKNIKKSMNEVIRMEKEYINYETREIMSRDEAIEWIEENVEISFNYTLDLKKLEKQAEVREILLETYFWTQEARERVYEKNGVQVFDISI